VSSEREMCLFFFEEGARLEERRPRKASVTLCKVGRVLLLPSRSICLSSIVLCVTDRLVRVTLGTVSWWGPRRLPVVRS